MYTQDYDERFPNGTFAGTPNTGASATTFYATGGILQFNTGYGDYQPLIYPYVKSMQVFFCPSSSSWTYSSGQFQNDYGISGYIFGYTPHGVGATESGTTSGRTLAELTDPSTTFMLADSATSGTSVIDRPIRIYARHLGGANLAFCDGHVKWMNASTITGQPSLYTPTTTGWPVPATTWGAPHVATTCTANDASCS